MDWICLRGITPAYAGRISLPELNFPILQDHPRIRGKNISFLSNTTIYTGSPPHTREEFAGVAIGTFGGRITPAYAGRIKVRGNYS